MDKTFEDIMNEVLSEEGYSEDTSSMEDESSNEDFEEESTNDNSEESNIPDDTDNSDVDSNVENPEEGNMGDESVEDLDQNPGTNEKDVQAFVKLRQENKSIRDENQKYKSTVDYFDNLAKQAGLQGVDDLISRYKEAEIKRNAEEQGVPVEVMKELNSLKEKVAEQDRYRKQLEAEKEDNRLSMTFETFAQTNHLDDKAINDLAQNLTKDGITLDNLKTMSNTAITRVLGAYLPKEVSKQAELAKKEQIKRELPPQSDSKSSKQTLDDDIDSLAKAFAGK